jgi:hypothetical protein
VHRAEALQRLIAQRAQRLGRGDVRDQRQHRGARHREPLLGRA